MAKIPLKPELCNRKLFREDSQKGYKILKRLICFFNRFNKTLRLFAFTLHDFAKQISNSDSELNQNPH